MTRYRLRRMLTWILGAAGFFLLFLWLAPGNFVWAIVGSIAGFVVGAMLSSRRAPAAGGVVALTGTGKTDYDRAMQEAWRKHRLLTNDAFRVAIPEVRQKIDAVADVIRRILEDLKADPNDFRQARQFLDYYLDATVKIVHRYADLSDKAAQDPEVQVSLRKTEELLENMRLAYEKQLRILLENDKLDLDTELAVLKRTIELEGLGRATDTKPLPGQ